MRTVEKYLLYGLVLYYCALVAVAIGTFLRKNEISRSIVYEWMIMFLLPFSGLFYLKFPIFHSQNAAGLDSFSSESKEKRQKIYITDVAKDKQLISIQDVLAINSVYEKRNVVMDLFSYDSAQYVKELQIALRDSDTEVSHYASAAIVGMKDRLDGKLFSTKKDFVSNPSDENADRYLVSIKTYIESGTLNVSMVRKYERMFCVFMDVWEEQDSTHKQEWLPTFLTYLTHLGDSEKALMLADRFVQETKSQDAYIAALKVSHSFQRTNDFHRYLAELKKENIVLTDYHYDILQFFLQNEVKHDKS